jgi:predicted transport protein
MAKTSGELEKEFIETAYEKTGKSLQEWLTLVKSSKILKQKDILEWLKKGHGLNHMQAQFVAGIFLNNGNPVYGNENALLENQFVKCPDMRNLFNTISESIISQFHGTQLIPKKTYLSFTSIREFAAINVKPKEIRLGLDLGDEPFTDVLQKSKLTGPMPRISHMIILTNLKQFNSKTKQYLEQSFNRTHKK